MSGKRVVFHGANASPCLEVQESEIPSISEGEILGTLVTVTICGSDLHTVRGKRKEATPSVLGHEGVVEVISHKRKNSNLVQGDRVTFHVADCCYSCEFCLDGLHQKCKTLFKYGHALLCNETGWNGCYATHIVLRKGTHVVKIPEHIPSKVAAPLNCALATMVAAVDEIHKRRTGQKETTRKRMALIQGAGLLGIYGCALLHEAGYDKVYCSDISSERLKMVSRFAGIPLGPGITCPEFWSWLWSKASGPYLAHAPKRTELVFQVCGVRQVLSEGIRVLRPGGTYVLVGMVHPDSRLDMVTAEQIIRKCLTIKGVHNYGPLHLDQAVSFIDQTASKFPYADLFSPTYRLENITSAFELAEEQKYFRVLIEPREHIP